MKILEAIRRRKRVTTGAAIGLIAIGLWLIGYQLFADKRSKQAPQGWFTTDDGATLFKDNVARVPPFDHGGHEAVGEVVYTADGGKHQWVQYLTKFDSTGRRRKAGPTSRGSLPTPRSECRW